MCVLAVFRCSQSVFSARSTVSHLTWCITDAPCQCVQCEALWVAFDVYDRRSLLSA